MLLKRLIILTILTTAFLQSASASTPEAVPADTTETAKKGNIINRVIRYFSESNKEDTTKRFDFSFIGGPHYSSEEKFGIGLVGAAIYRSDPHDRTTIPSNISLKVDASTALFYTVGLEGLHILPGDRARFEYDASFEHVNTRFWGIGFENGINDANETKFKYITARAHLSYLWKLPPGIHIGPSLSVDYLKACNFHNTRMLNNQDNHTFNLGVGVTVLYDTRDNTTAPGRGLLLKLEQRFNSRVLFNEYAFSMTEFTASSYYKAWRGAVIAWQIHTRLTYGNTPWGLLSTFGGSNNMRGYFEGRFRDKGEADLCVELRQHVWRRSSAVVWAGVGSVFPRIFDIKFNQLLPNAGIGYRWEFKKNVNVRLDLGFGRKQCGFIFNINEAF